jgi:flavin reductase (DIM6/NTAB) family NADH-FMN oxidoreductase RutF
MSGLWATGVAVVTTVAASGKYHGLTMNGLTSLSLAPPLFLVCIDKKSATNKALGASRVFCISILARGQESVAKRFASKGDHKFETIAVKPGLDGAPLIEGALATLECRVTKAVDGGDHTVYFGAVQAAHAGHGEPLLFYRGAYGRLHAAD